MNSRQSSSERVHSGQSHGVQSLQMCTRELRALGVSNALDRCRVPIQSGAHSVHRGLTSAHRLLCNPDAS